MLQGSLWGETEQTSLTPLYAKTFQAQVLPDADIVIFTNFQLHNTPTADTIIINIANVNELIAARLHQVIIAPFKFLI